MAFPPRTHPGVSWVECYHTLRRRRWPVHTAIKYKVIYWYFAFRWAFRVSDRAQIIVILGVVTRHRGAKFLTAPFTITTARCRHSFATHPPRHCIACSSGSNCVVPCASPPPTVCRTQRRTPGASKSPHPTTHLKSKECCRGLQQGGTQPQGTLRFLQGVPAGRLAAAQPDKCP